VKIIDLVDGDPARDEPPYIVMELLHGRDLQALIKAGPIAVSHAVDIMLQVCAAVSACHLRGFVHRDLKTTNIFVTEYNRIETVKVLDFGVAKLRADVMPIEDVASVDVTRSGMVFGTPEYLAPEVFRGAVAGPATDQYALGVLLYAALANGRKPFEADKSLDRPELKLCHAIVGGEHLLVRAHRPEVPPGLERVVERALSREAELRFPSVHEFGRALLPWASEGARLLWEVHFRIAPAPPPVHSTTFRPELVEYARRLFGPPNASGPNEGLRMSEGSSVGVHEMPGITSAVGELEPTLELALGGAPAVQAGASDEGVPLATRDISILEDPDAIMGDGGPDSAVTISVSAPMDHLPTADGTSTRSSRPLGRRPAVLAVLAVCACLAGIGVVVLAHRSHGRPWPRVMPPAEIANARATLADERPSEAPQLPVTVPHLAVVADVAPVVVPPPPVLAQGPHRRPRRTPHPPKPRPVFDDNGIGIPSD
jgi:hypothetical protein